MSTFRCVSVLTLPIVFCLQSLGASAFVQTNLVSDGVVAAANIDPNLKDPWGVSFSIGATGTSSPIWVSDRETGVSTLYAANTGAPAGGPLIVTVPPGTASTGPTGQVSGSGGTFTLNGSAVSFIFDTLGGTIDAWNGGTTATVVATTSGASYTGLARINNTLYAANFVSGGGINAFNSSFAATTLSGNFSDPNVPAGYAPFNIQAINGLLYVEYAQVTPGVPVPTGGGGYVAVFDANGNLVQHLVSNGALDAPWGVTIAPAGFGMFGGDVLVGNFLNGEINAFDPTTGAFVGTLDGPNGSPIVNSGLWALTFDTGTNAVQNALYFTAGPNGGADGVFGYIQATPEPAAWSLAGLGLIALGVLRRRYR